MTDLPPDDSTPRPNVAVVVLDTLRKDAFDEQFSWLSGLRFENAWSPSHWTVPVHASLFGGRYASEMGTHAKSHKLDHPDQVLAERLRDAGYTTRAFSCNVNISPQSGFDRGFEEFRGNWRVRSLDENLFDWGSFHTRTKYDGALKYLDGVYQCLRDDCPTIPSLKRGTLLKLRDFELGGIVDDDGAQEALDWVRETTFGDKEFLFINLMEAHTPYHPPKPYRTVDPIDTDGLRWTLGEPDQDPERVEQAYHDSVRYLSAMYQKIHSELIDWFDYVITVSDHGELLGEHGAWDHLCGLYPELTHVPLVISGDGMPNDTETATVSLLDVHRTISELAAIKSGPRGQFLLGDVEGGEYLSEYHGIGKMLSDALSAEEYDVTAIDRNLNALAAPTSYYGYETPDGFFERGEATSNDPHARLAELVTELDDRPVTDDDVPESIKSHLRDLGYA